MNEKSDPSKIRTRIDVRCSLAEKQTIEELARVRGLSVSEFIRSQIFGRKMVIRVGDYSDPKTYLNITK